jgi:hypothetical protein
MVTDIVPPPEDPSTNAEGVQRFDSTFAVQDNKVYGDRATEIGCTLI